MSSSKKLSPVEIRKLKIVSLCGLLAREEYGTISFLKIKLTKAEWAGLIQTKQCTAEQAEHCINHLDMLAPDPVTKSRFDSLPENIKAAGERIEKALSDFLRSYEKDLRILSDAGYHLSPQWRNDARKGIRKKKDK